MKRPGQILLVTLVRGVLFLVPLVLVLVLAREGYQILRQVFEPLARRLPVERLVGVLVEDLITVLAIVLVFLLAGLFVGTGPGRRLSGQLERSVLYRVPGYFLVRGAVGSLPGLDSESHPEPALVESEEGWALALLIERAPPGYCTVFLPDSPTPTSGAVRIVEEGRVRVLEVSMLQMLGCLTRSGAGAGELAAPALAAGRPLSGPPLP